MNFSPLRARFVVEGRLQPGARTIVLTSQLRTGDRVDELVFRRVFTFSIVYLFLLFAVYRKN